MRLTMRERHAVTQQLPARFRRASKKERGQILDAFTELTGYTRCYAAFLLRNCGKKQLLTIRGRRLIFVPGLARRPGATRGAKGRYRSNPVFLDVLKRLWALSDGLGGKRLVAFLREAVPHLERSGALRLRSEEVRAWLLQVSPATVDRLLVKTKREARLKTRSSTRPGTLLKHHIPIRTFADWNELEPGFCEVDLVAHEGGAAIGDYCQTLTLTDVATGWTEARAVKNKAQCHVFEALTAIRAQLPFALRGLDSDNGSEFINAHLQYYCQKEHITFTRSRPYRNNDNCYVEQKNYSIVRRTVGYYRYDRPEHLKTLGALYQRLRLYTNFFQPVMKLKEKVRTGSHLTRRYDHPQTPFRRLLDHPLIDQTIKASLQQQYQALNLLKLKRELNRLQQSLFQQAIKAGPPPVVPRYPHFPTENHPWRTRALGAGISTRIALKGRTPVVRSTVDP
jgi:hypothetical protein